MDTGLNTIIREALNNAYEDIVRHLDLCPGKGTHSVVARNLREAHLAIIEELEELETSGSETLSSSEEEGDVEIYEP